MTGRLELWLLVLLVAVAGLVVLSNALKAPYPVFLVLGGLVLGLVPFVPDFELPPELVLLIFLPPLLYSAAFFSSPRDLRANLRPIAFLAIGLVLLTTFTVAAVAHWAVGLPWVAAVATGAFSLSGAALQFALYGTGGAVIGLLVGWVISRVRRKVEDPLVEVTISLFTPYAAYIPAEDLGASGVLAAVAAGLYLGWYSPEMSAPRNRLQSFTVWEVLPFLLNSVLFILVGLQLPNVLERIFGEYSLASGLVYAALVTAVVVGTRLVWTFPVAYIPQFFSRSLRERDPYPSWRYVAVIAYTGMRGAVSLAAALAIPLTVEGGAPFPGRDLILFLTFCVILVTLAPQGLSLPFVLRRLGLTEGEGEEEREETEARLRAAEAALKKIDELSQEDWVREDTAGRMRDLYEYRRRRFAARAAGQAEDGEEDGDYEARSLAYQRFRRELLGAERAALLRLRDQRRLSDEARRRIERDLDLEDARLEI